jgi:hypothetical protein
MKAIDCTLDFILYARENGITLVIFPRYCSHLLRSLDAGVMRSFNFLAPEFGI